MAGLLGLVALLLQIQLLGLNDDGARQCPLQCFPDTQSEDRRRMCGRRLGVDGRRHGEHRVGAAWLGSYQMLPRLRGQASGYGQEMHASKIEKESESGVPI
ncbi:hypothetical protein [Ralstonia pseudosolanacearum]|uniref:hypothetical protein n=1 Tax=Ralstonia pseudosolanacearum TaxID=1310165 RepID=UPI002677495F|nr:hypothetical protein [Ralstonia pseudosolanacearum]MDO3515055.1 hypothetical protein [Ralstonia pseudosolanacearum]MDO3539831.1 hypothetical protein [Ralstonia pseudosolanacearum]MDO3578295.1 hypothetical protein [Ralstonia pseudosolanacearum]MDO3633762.1 hypothetical protein [Ralstonia pseudosolanacearum]